MPPNPRCCFPGHLSGWGGPRANCADRDGALRRRVPTGEANWSSRLSQAQADQIRRERMQGLTLSELARRYDVGSTTVANLVNGLTYKEAGT